MSHGTRGSGSRNYMSGERRWDNELIRSADKGGHWTMKMGFMSWYILVNLGPSREARRPCSYLPGPKDRWLTGCDFTSNGGSFERTSWQSWASTNSREPKELGHSRCKVAGQLHGVMSRHASLASAARKRRGQGSCLTLLIKNCFCDTLYLLLALLPYL